MIDTVLIVAGVCGLGASFLGIVHHFWLGKSLTETAVPDRQRKESRKRERFEKTNGRVTVGAKSYGAP